jgi:hypothetical protein
MTTVPGAGGLDVQCGCPTVDSHGGLWQETLQRLEAELASQQQMLQAKAEAEAQLRAEVGRLAEENGRLQAERLEHEGRALGLQELLEEMSQESEAAKVCGARPASRRPVGLPDGVLDKAQGSPCLSGRCLRAEPDGSIATSTVKMVIFIWCPEFPVLAACFWRPFAETCLGRRVGRLAASKWALAVMLVEQRRRGPMDHRRSSCGGRRRSWRGTSTCWRPRRRPRRCCGLRLSAWRKRPRGCGVWPGQPRASTRCAPATPTSVTPNLATALPPPPSLCEPWGLLVLTQTSPASGLL